MDELGTQSIETILAPGTRLRATDVLWNMRKGHAYVVKQASATYALPDRRSSDDFLTFVMEDETTGKETKLEGLRDEITGALLYKRIIKLSSEPMPQVEKPEMFDRRVIKYVEENPGQPMHLIQKGMDLPTNWVGPDSSIGINSNLSSALSRLVKKRALWSVKKPNMSVDGARAAGVFYATKTHPPPRRTSRFEDSF